MRTAYQSSYNIRQFESIKKGHSVPTIYFLIIYTDKCLESDRLRECKNEETDTAKRGKKIQISQRMEHFDWMITNQV